MKRYRVIGEIILSFLDGNNQRDFIVDPKDHGVIECDGKTVWYVNGGGQKHESITTANIVEFGVKNGLLTEETA